MRSTVGKFLLACLLCIGIIAGIVMLLQYVFA